MTADLASSPTSGIEIMCCGDAHPSNFDDFHQLRAAAAAGEIEVADDPAR